MKTPFALGLVGCVAVGMILFLRTRQSARVTPRAYSENEGWVVQRGGEVIEKKGKSGLESLNSWEHLVYCLYMTDYMMRNAGDFANAADLYPNFQSDGKRFAEALALPATTEAFSLSERKLQREYFDRFEMICNELKHAEPAVPPNGGPSAPSGPSTVSKGPPSVN